MQISLKWINELVHIQNVDLDKLINKLTLGGFEVEDIIEVEINNKKEIALEISATANRSDSLSVQGISNEISALLNTNLTISNYQNQILPWQQKIKTIFPCETLEPNCPTLLAFTIEKLDKLIVPKWVQEKLISSGISPTNSITDFQNYILLETGYPLAFYDLEKIYSALNQNNFDLNISSAEENEKFKTQTNEYQLNESILTIKANNLTLGIAGIIENDNFSCSQETNSILIEASIFTASKIRQQSRLLNLRTIRSTRYEKSLKSTFLLESVYRLILLLRIANPTLLCKLHTIKKNLESRKKPIKLYYKSINEILGPISTKDEVEIKYLEDQIVSQYLSRLRFNFSYDRKENCWDVIIPDSRTEDLIREIDLIEEIGRLHGFNNFLTNLPEIKTIGKEDNSYQTRKKLTDCMLKEGFTEFIHYSLVNNKKFLTNEVSLVNPLLADSSSLRISLLPDLINTVQNNLKQGNDNIEGFEYGHIFLKDSNNNFKEQEYIAGIFGGFKTKSEWSIQSRSLSWFEAKGRIEKLLTQLELKVDWRISKLKKYERIFHPYRKADLVTHNKDILGTFGQIHPILANQCGLSKEIYLFEFNFEIVKLMIQSNKLSLYKEYLSFPKITKDLSFIVSQTIQFDDLKNILLLNGTKFLSNVNLLDEYRGSNIPENHVSLCLQLTFQSKERTLENKEVEVIVDKLERLLNSKFNARIRA